MNARVLTLFGEEIVPEQLKVVPKKGIAVNAGTEKASRLKSAEQLLAGWEPSKQYYSIGEVAALFEMRTSHIRFWTNEFELEVRTTRKGDRLFTPANIASLRAIYHLVKERGFKIAGAKAKLKEPDKVSVTALDLRQSLLKLRNQLLLIRNKLV